MTNRQRLKKILEEIDPEQYDEFDDAQYTLNDEEIEERATPTRILGKKPKVNNKKSKTVR